MSHQLKEGSLQVIEGRSVVAPVQIEGLPPQIEALGERLSRKLEFHITVVPADVVERAANSNPDAWELVARTLSGRAIGPIAAGDDVRRVTYSDKPALRTVIVMVAAGGIERLYDSLSEALDAELTPPPTHVTLYSTDPAEGIGINDQAQLAERAPPLPQHQQRALRRAMCFEEVFFDDGGIALDPDEAPAVSVGRTDHVFTPRAIRAIAYAAHVHAEQRRKGGRVPYLAHLLAVASLVAEDGGSESEVIGALLHDTAEDHGGERRLTDVCRRFGAEAEKIVRALSDTLEGEGEQKEPWRPRKERYLARLREETSLPVLRVSNADKLHNARSILTDYARIGDAIWDRFQAPAQDQLWYYRELVAIFSDKRDDSSLARDLAETVAALERELKAPPPQATGSD